MTIQTPGGGRALLLLLTCGFALLVYVFGPFEAPSQQADLDGVRAEEPAQSAASAELRGVESAPDTSAAQAEEDAGERRALAEPEPESALVDELDGLGHGPADGFLLRVVRAEDEVPLGGARVYWVGNGALHPAEMAAAMASGGGVEALFARVGQSYATDERGEVRLPLESGAGYVGARHADRFGMREVSERVEEPAVLAIAPETRIAVDVRTHRGAPAADVPVAIYIRENDYVGRMMVFPTDADGRASVGPLEPFSDSIDEHEALGIGLALAGSEVQRSWLDLDALPEDPLVFELPPAAALEVELVDAAGSPIGGASEFFVGVMVAPEDPAQDELVALDVSERGQLAVASEGRARFAHVEAGVPLLVVAQHMGSEEVALQRLDPLAVDARETASLVLESDGVRLSAELVDEGGQPMANARVRWRVRAAVGWPGVEQGAVAQSDAAGRIELVVDAAVAEASRTHDLSLETIGAPVPARAQRELSELGTQSSLDLGRVALQREEVLLSGVVRLPDGAPARRARVLVEQELGDGWWPVRLEGALSDSEGRFELRGEVRGEGALRASASKEGFRPARPLPFARGLRDAQLELVLAGALEVELVGVESRDALEVRLQLIDPRGQGVDRPLREDRRVARWSGLESGSYALELSLRHENQSFHRIEGIEVRAGETARIEALDLAAWVSAIEIRVRDTQGAPVEEAEVYSAPPGTYAQALGRGPVQRALCSTLGLSLFVDAPGFRSQRLEGVRADLDLVLERGYAVRLVLRGGNPVEAPEHLGLVLYRASEGDWLASRQLGGELDALGEVGLELPLAGAYSVEASLAHDERPIALRVSGGDDSLGASIEVLDVEYEQRFEIELPEGWLEREREALPDDD